MVSLQRLLSGHVLKAHKRHCESNCLDCIECSALLWGTSAPAMRYLYLQGIGEAPKPSIIAAVQTTGAALCLVLLDAASRRWSRGDKETAAYVVSDGQAENSCATVVPSSAVWPINLLLTATQSSVRAAGFEVGLWAFMANCLTVIGFENTTTSRGTFLIRLSAMFTPIIAAVGGEEVTLPVWLGCFAAFSGGILISADSSSQAEGSSFLNLSSGDVYIIIAAVLWSIQTVRMGTHAPKFKPIQLAKFQIVTMSVFSGLWLVKDAFAAYLTDNHLQSLWGGYSQPLNWGVLLIPAIGPWSVGVALQAKGQSSVSSSSAMIILATDPLWAILFAGLVGGNEQHLGSLGWVGAVSILSASIIASFGKQ